MDQQTTGRLYGIFSVNNLCLANIDYVIREPGGVHIKLYAEDKLMSFLPRSYIFLDSVFYGLIRLLEVDLRTAQQLLLDAYVICHQYRPAESASVHVYGVTP